MMACCKAQDTKHDGDVAFCTIFRKTIARDIRMGMLIRTAENAYNRVVKNNETIALLFEKIVSKYPSKNAFIDVGGRSWTFQDVHLYSNVLANYMQSEGYTAGDTIALFLENSPEIPIFWLALAKMGITAALINDNLRSSSLVHCINVAKAKAVIFSGQYSSAMLEIRRSLDPGMRCYCYGEYDPSVFEAVHLNPELNRRPTHTPTVPLVNVHDALIYIYTSGTTGLPKAAIISHARYYLATFGTHCKYLRADDIVYDPLPLYHSAGGILGAGQALLMGCTVVVRKKFSASNFWDDCIKHNCTAMQYIGEMCRYLMVQPPRQSDTKHKIRVAIGNGLRPQIWKRFKARFNLTTIGEFYAASEGNCANMNPDDTVGAIGSLSRIFSKMNPSWIVKVEQSTGELIRNNSGMCILCKPGERGELVGKIKPGDRMRGFDGYTNKDATQQKIATNVFTKGDHVFRTGDILVMDDLGYLYFCDRIGDTYRWKGENVATAEVEAIISDMAKLNDAVSYGVQIPGTEGRAGMVAIVEENGQVDLKQLYADMKKALPSYACPVFIRILSNLDLTVTFKLMKINYRKQGFDPSYMNNDRLYYLDKTAGEYKTLDEQVYQDIYDGKIRF